MRETDLVVSVSADDQEVLGAGVNHEVFEKGKCRRINPLKVIKKKDQRVFPLGECTEEPPENHLKPVLCFLRGKLRNWRLRPDDQFKLREEVHDKLAVRVDGFPDQVPPMANLLLALAQNLPDQDLKRLRQGDVRDVSLVLVKFPGNEDAARKSDRLP
jgi:hypothetical protein